MILTEILESYQFNTRDCILTPFGNGLINNTWKIKSGIGNSSYILQKINTAVFKEPGNIAENIKIISSYLQKRFPFYLFISPVKTAIGDEMYVDKEKNYYRVFPFVEGSQSFDVLTEPKLAFEAAQQFGLFTKLHSDFQIQSLKVTLPDFHNLTLRFRQFLTALENGNKERTKRAGKSIFFLLTQKNIVDVFEAIRSNPQFKLRVTHHDTKISNVLFSNENKGICVIDLDTVMPGYFISDIGDMMRTYLSPVSEDESDFSKIEIREDYFQAISEGYLSQMKDELNQIEKRHFVYAGKFLIYMQALRFLTDYLNNDVYYGSKYEEHNFIRAQNQIVLLQRFIKKEKLLNKIVENLQTVDA